MVTGTLLPAICLNNQDAGLARAFTNQLGERNENT